MATLKLARPDPEPRYKMLLNFSKHIDRDMFFYWLTHNFVELKVRRSMTRAGTARVIIHDWQEFSDEDQALILAREEIR